MKTDINAVYTTLFNEDLRLCQDKASSVEYITNSRYILDALNPGDKVLELGAATGRYTVMLAERGFDVTAVEIVQNNLDQLKKKLTPTMSVTPVLGNAIDLSAFEDASFDVVLNMGPLYHFPNKVDQDKVVKETMRVLKPGGTAFFAFINNDMVFVTEAFLYNPLFLTDNDKNYNKETHKVVDEPFTFHTIESVQALMNKHDLKAHKFIASEGLAELMKDHINNLTDEEFANWMQFHFYMCEKRESLNTSHHVLYITKK